MITIRDVEHKQVVDFFNEDPALCYQSLPDNTLMELYTTNTFTKEDVNYLGIYKDTELVCVLKYSFFTEMTINIHPYLKTVHQRTSLWGEIQKHLREYFKQNSKITKVIAMIPSTCLHTVYACKKFGFEKEGEITNSLIWRQEVVSILIYGLNLREQ